MGVILFLALTGFFLAWYGGRMDREERRRQDQEAEAALADVIWRRDHGLL